MPGRRGISELIGALIIITIITLTIITYTYIIYKTTDKVEKRLSEKSQQIIDKIYPISIYPINNNGKLDLIIAPTKINELIKVIIYNLEDKSIIQKEIESNGTYVRATILNNYNCEKIKILLILESGAIIQYNALLDYRVIKPLEDPTIFTCSILSENKNNKILDKHINEIIDLRSQENTINIPSNKNILINISGTAFKLLDYNIHKCNLNVTVNNNSDIIKQCSYNKKINQIKIGNNIINIYLRIRSTENYIIGYLVFNETTNYDLAFKIYIKYGLLVRNALISKYDETVGSLYNSVMPAPMAQATEGEFNATWRVESFYAGGYSVKAIGDGNVELISNGAVLLFMSSLNKPIIFHLYYNIQITNIYISNEQSYNISKYFNNILKVNRTELVRIVPLDPLTEMIYSINLSEWYGEAPIVAVEYKKYHLTPNSNYIFYCPDSCQATFVFSSSALKLPMLSSISYNESLVKHSEGHLYYITMKIYSDFPKPLTGLPFLVEIYYDNTIEYWLVADDKAGMLQLNAINRSDWIGAIIGFSLAGIPINAVDVGGDVVCLVPLGRHATLPVITQYSIINTSGYCDSEVVLGRQTLYLYSVVDFPAGRVDYWERVISSYYSVRILYSS